MALAKAVAAGSLLSEIVFENLLIFGRQWRPLLAAAAFGRVEGCRASDAGHRQSVPLAFPIRINGIIECADRARREHQNRSQ